MKIKILYQLNQLGYGGTEKAIFTFLQNLNLTQFEPYVYFNTDYKSLHYYRKKILSLLSKKYRKKFRAQYITAFARYQEFEKIVGKSHIYVGNGIDDFLSTIANVNPNIIHFNRGNEEDFYTSHIQLIPNNIICVETNIFGKSSNINYMNRLSKIFLVSRWLMDRYNWNANTKAKVLYNPICLPKTELTLREELSIPKNSIVLGRISRPNLDNGEFIENILSSILNNDIYFITIGASEDFKQKTQSNKYIICLNPTTDEVYLSKFYNTIDVLLHYRKEGETFGMNIAEAMIHGKPVISHKSNIDNAQIELLLQEVQSGYIVNEINAVEYIEKINLLIHNSNLLYNMGNNAKRIALQKYAEKIVTKQLESYYLSI